MTNNEAVTGSTTFLVAIFCTFERYVINLKGTYVEMGFRDTSGALRLPFLTPFANCMINMIYSTMHRGL
jgi:hypothetical protein